MADARVVRGNEPRIEVRTNRGDELTVSIDNSDFPESAHLVPADDRGHLLVDQMHIW